MALNLADVGSWSLVTGRLPLITTALGFVALVVLLIRRDRPYWTRVVPVVVASCLGVVVAFDVVVEVIWKPFPDRLPVSNLAWGWLGMVALGLAGARMRSSSWRMRVVAAVAAMAVVVTAVAQINIIWGLYPTVHAAWEGLWSHPGGLPDRTGPGGPVVVDPPGETMLDVWKPPSGMPDTGTVSEVTIPGTVSHFHARPGYVYLPPAYMVSPRPLLPIIVLLSGQPGTPDNWINWLQLPAAMDAFARAHKGLAPVVVMPDDLGGTFDNPLCVDSPRGNAETYLAQDVPAWVQSTLQVADDRTNWFIGGFSHGGTCSLQLALRAPQIYGGFIDIAGEIEPTLGNRKNTVKKVFGGSQAAFERINPMDILHRERFPDTSALIIEGAQDLGYADARKILGACQGAGMKADWVELPGTHTPEVWRAAGARAIPWVSVHSRLIPPTSGTQTVIPTSPPVLPPTSPPASPAPSTSKPLTAGTSGVRGPVNRG